MINRINYLLIALVFFALVFAANGQVDSVVGQVTNSEGFSFAGGISADGRLIVFESNGNLATENPRNDDFSNEIFIFDYAQRRIFQITNTRSVLHDLNEGEFTFNIRVDITTSRPVISADGRWIAFGSNATTSVAGSPADGTNPGSFDGNDYTVSDGDPGTEDPNPLTEDGNMEMWLYAVPAVAPADLTSGDEIPITDLSAGTFTLVTNTPAAIPPVPGSTTQQPSISTDNRIPSISDNGKLVAFISNRNLVGTGNQVPNDNPEIFVYERDSGSGELMSQITQTPRGPIGAPITNSVPTIAGNGSRVMFSSNGHNPIVGMTGGDNTDGNREVFFSDLTPNGAPTGVKKQITVTTQTTPGSTVNAVGFGRRMSRNGNLIVFDSYADLANEHAGTNQAGFATFLYDVTANSYRRIAARSNADAGASGGDIERLPGFTDYDVSGVPRTLIMETRMNIAPDGTIPTDPANGLNNSTARQAQVYTLPLDVPAANATFKRITTLPAPGFALATIQPIPSDSSKRVAINLPGSEIGTGNPDFSTEVYYILQKNVTRETAATFRFSTGATKIPVQNTPVATLSVSDPDKKKTASKTNGKPSLGGTPTPTPTPGTPPAVQGLSPGMLAFLDFTAGINTPVVARTAVGSIDRRFRLPIELSGVTMTISGAAVELKSVSQRQIYFVVPPGLRSDPDNPKPIVVNFNGTVMRGEISIVQFRPDIFRTVANPEANRARLENITNRVRTTEPFNVLTFKYRGSRKVPTVLRLYATGILFAQGTSTVIRFGTTPTAGTISDPIELEPGVFAFDFTLSPDLQGVGDQAVVIGILGSSGSFQSRLEADAPRTRIL